MSFPTGTILTRLERRGDPLDVVTVVGPSPIRSVSLGEWQGASGDILVVNPTEEFGAAENMPTSIAEGQYEVTYWPEEPDREIALAAKKRSMAHKETPEQVFSREARDAKKAAAKPKSKTVA